MLINSNSELFIQDFIYNNKDYINNLCLTVYDGSKLSFDAFKEIISIELNKAYNTFVRKNYNFDSIKEYLFGCIHNILKKIRNEGKYNAYICPGCKFLSRIEFLSTINNKLYCNYCRNCIDICNSNAQEFLHKTFSEHSKKGYKCPYCNNFIPDNDTNTIVCPYPSCTFVGKTSNLKIMRHPSIKTQFEVGSVSSNINSDIATDTHLIVKDSIYEYIKILNECVDYQMNFIHHKTNKSTLMNKLCMYQAYKNMINKFPNEMISYLIYFNRNLKIQHKIFQEFIKLLENKIPFSFEKNGKYYQISSLLDSNLCIFNGMSEFNSIVNSNNEILNSTKELYFNSKKGYRPYYFGKVIDIINVSDNKSIINDLYEYNFFKIFMKKNVLPGTKVYVKHLRIYPHYSMGGMTYLNRIRRAIVDKVYFSLNGKKRIMSK